MPSDLRQLARELVDALPRCTTILSAPSDHEMRECNRIATRGIGGYEADACDDHATATPDTLYATPLRALIKALDKPETLERCVDHPIRPIRTDGDHAEALKEIERLWELSPGMLPSTPEGDRLEVLAVLVSEYERSLLKGGW